MCGKNANEITINGRFETMAVLCSLLLIHSSIWVGIISCASGFMTIVTAGNVGT